MAEATNDIIMMVYRGDERMFEKAQLWVERFVPEVELKLLAQRLRTLHYRQGDLLLRLTNRDLAEGSASPKVSQQLQWKLEDDMETYAEQTWGMEWYDAFQKRKDVEDCDQTLEEAYLLWVELRAETLVTFAKLLMLILRRIEVIFKEPLPSLLSGFMAGRASRYSAGVMKTDTNKFIEERTALMYVVAYAILPPDGNVLEELERIIRSAVRVAGLRLATSYQPDLGRLEEEASAEWFSLHAPETVMKQYNWIEVVSKGSGVHKKATFLFHPTYATGDKLFGGRFPTPFYVVPEVYWKHSIIKEEMFPADILSGRIPLEPMNTNDLFLISKHKQSPSNLIIGARGTGKSSIINATGCWRIDRGYVVFRPTMPRIQDMLSCLPMSPAQKDDWARLKALRLKPRAMPCRFITIYQTAEDVHYDEPYTIYDWKVRVDDLEDFKLNWSKLLDGFPRGYLMFRDLTEKKRTQKMRSNVINEFFYYRRLDRSRKISLTIDEVQDVYGAVFSSSEEAELVRTMQSQMNDIRGLGVASEFATRSPSMLQPDILESVATFIFAEVKESGADESRSSRQRLLKALASRMPDTEKKFLVLIERIMENRQLSDPTDPRGPHLFFHDYNNVLRLVQATLAPHMCEDPEIDTKTQIENYDKATGKKTLVQGWDQVPLLDAAVKGRRTASKGLPAYGVTAE